MSLASKPSIAESGGRLFFLSCTPSLSCLSLRTLDSRLARYSLLRSFSLSNAHVLASFRCFFASFIACKARASASGDTNGGTRERVRRGTRASVWEDTSTSSRKTRARNETAIFAQKPRVCLQRETGCERLCASECHAPSRASSTRSEQRVRRVRMKQECERTKQQRRPSLTWTPTETDD